MPLLRYTITIPAPIGERFEPMLAAIAEKLGTLMNALAEHVKADKLSGQVLKARTGRLAGSVAPDPVQVSGTTVVSGVRAGGAEAFYAPFHEFGGSRGYTIVPVDKRALAFDWNGMRYIREQVFRKPLPARPYMAPSLEEMTPGIVDGIREAVMSAFE